MAGSDTAVIQRCRFPKNSTKYIYQMNICFIHSCIKQPILRSTALTTIHDRATKCRNHISPISYDGTCLHRIWGFTWCRHQMRTLSELLVLCVGNSPVTGELPSQWPVTQLFDIFFDLRLNKPLSKTIVRLEFWKSGIYQSVISWGTLL